MNVINAISSLLEMMVFQDTLKNVINNLVYSRIIFDSFLMAANIRGRDPGVMMNQIIDTSQEVLLGLTDYGELSKHISDQGKFIYFNVTSFH
mgnify:CR=1 FL=1